MNLFYEIIVKECSDKMSGYLTLLHFRYMNLCVKSEPASLMPVNISFLGEDKNIEDVAQVGQPDDFHLAVIPENKNMTNLIAQSIFMVHPEFKLARKTFGSGDEATEYLEYEMPEVDKNRRDFLNEAIKSLHDEAKVRIDEVHAQQKADLADYIKEAPSELDEVNKELDKLHDEYITKIHELRNTKTQEVEEGYQRYLSEHGNQANEGENPGLDVTTNMVMQ